WAWRVLARQPQRQISPVYVFHNETRCLLFFEKEHVCHSPYPKNIRVMRYLQPCLDFSKHGFPRKIRISLSRRSEYLQCNFCLFGVSTHIDCAPDFSKGSFTNFLLQIES